MPGTPWRPRSSRPTVLAVSGRHGDGVARTDVDIVAGSGTGELSGITGSGSYTADAMNYTLTLDYELSEDVADEGLA